MHADDLVVDQSSDRQAVEALSEHFPQFDAVPSLAFVVESINSIDSCAFVVSSQQEEVLWVLDLVSKQQADGLNVVFSSINVISKEKVVGIRRKLSVLKQSEQIVVLAMDIALGEAYLTTNFQWGLKFKQNRLLGEDLSGLATQGHDFHLCQVDKFAGLGASDLQKPLDDGIHIESLVLATFASLHSIKVNYLQLALIIKLKRTLPPFKNLLTISALFVLLKRPREVMVSGSLLGRSLHLILG